MLKLETRKFQLVVVCHTDQLLFPPLRSKLHLPTESPSWQTLLPWFHVGPRGDRAVVLAAVQSDGLALEFAAENLRDDKDLVLAAVKTNGHALQFAQSFQDGIRGMLGMLGMGEQLVVAKKINRN